MRTLACVAWLALLAGCGSTPSPTDMAVTMDLSTPADMTAVMGCGAMGDVGNSKHVGQFCDSTHACPSGTVCASAFFPGATFCTIGAPCNCPSGMGCVDTATCGENTVCIYSSMFTAAGCAPAACANVPQG